MPANDNGRPRVASRNGGKSESTSTANVVSLLPRCAGSSPFDQLTVDLIMRQHERGELDSRLMRVLAEFAVGLWP